MVRRNNKGLPARFRRRSSAQSQSSRYFPVAQGKTDSLQRCADRLSSCRAPAAKPRTFESIARAVSSRRSTVPRDPIWRCWMKGQPEKTIKLALQGGGSHGAFTWGVLDQILEDERIRIEALSGTSAGAMNAVALADGMARGPAE